MPSWSGVIDEISTFEEPLDAIRHRYLRTLHSYTQRNVITYYSAFIQKPGLEGTGIDENDKNAFMQAVYGLDKSLGLDLVLHTPGGEMATTESLVTYLHSIFGNDIRVIVPQISMSAGTMIALASKEIIMGKQSNLGPIDPQFGGLSCAGIIEEFEAAIEQVRDDPSTAAIWGQIIGKYHPTFIGDCKKAISWSESMVRSWLCENMFNDKEDKDSRASKILETLSSHNKTYSHSRHIHSEELKSLGLKIVDLEDMDNREIDNCKDFQDCVLTLHHTYMHTFSTSNAIKIVENHNGDAMIMGMKHSK